MNNNDGKKKELSNLTPEDLLSTARGCVKVTTFENGMTRCEIDKISHEELFGTIAHLVLVLEKHSGRSILEITADLYIATTLRKGGEL